MTEKPIREAEEIRRDCARKLRSVETSGMFTAIVAALLGEDWSTPKIEELRISPDRCLLTRVEGDVTFKAFLGAEAEADRLDRDTADFCCRPSRANDCAPSQRARLDRVRRTALGFHRHTAGGRRDIAQGCRPGDPTEGSVGVACSGPIPR